MVAFTLLLPNGAPPTGSVETTVHLGVEHTERLRLSLSVSRGKIPALLQVSHDGAETAFLSLPESWALQEVKNARIADVPADAPTFGFRRWHLPPGAILTLSIPSPPDGAVVNNPSRVPLELRVTRIDLLHQTTERDVYLTTDQPQKIW